MAIRLGQVADEKKLEFLSLMIKLQEVVEEKCPPNYQWWEEEQEQEQKQEQAQAVQ